MKRSVIFLAALLALPSFAAAQDKYSLEDLARHTVERSVSTYDRAREFERMFRLYEPPPAGRTWQSPDVVEIPTEGRAVKE